MAVKCPSSVRFSDSGVRLSDSGVRLSDFGVRLSDFGVRLSDFCPIVRFWSPIVRFLFDCPIQESDCPICSWLTPGLVAELSYSHDFLRYFSGRDLLAGPKLRRCPAVFGLRRSDSGSLTLFAYFGRFKAQEAKIAKLREAMARDPALRRATPLTREPSIVDGALIFKGQSFRHRSSYHCAC